VNGWIPAGVLCEGIRARDIVDWDEVNRRYEAALKI
jgi:hypothetical protein